MSRKDLLDHTIVTSPCQQDWNTMTGNDRVRFCDHCSRHVHNLAELTRTDALRLVRQSKGRLCIRYFRDPNAELLARAASTKLHQISRRVSRIAAGVFSASISLSSVAVTASTNNQGTTAPVVEAVRSHTETSMLTARVLDMNGALIPGAMVLITSPEGDRQFRSTDDAGEFRLENLAPGNYSLRIVARGFEVLDTQVYVPGGELRLDYTLSAAPVTQEIVVGGAGVASPEDPFVLAASNDDIDGVVSLITARDVDFRDKRSGTRALEHAVENSNREMVQLLLARGADVNARNNAKQTVLMMLGDDATADLVWDLINAGGDVNGEDEDGDTPLTQAAAENNLEVLKTLLDAGAKVDHKNKAGQTALMLAASNGLTNNVRLLILAGSPLDAVDEDGKNALAYAEEENQRPVVRLLRRHGAVAIVKPDEEQ